MNLWLNIPISLVAIALLAGTPACTLLQRETEESIMQQYYHLDSQGILETIGEGKTDEFSPLSQRPDDVPVAQQITVNWTQEDYLHIAEAFHEEVWGETLENWKLNKMDFRLDCAEVEHGFQNGRFEFFQVVKRGDQEVRVVHLIDIDPRNNFVYAWEREYYPKILDWAVIEIGEHTLTANEVLQIAETKGGRDKRRSIDNACDIDLIISPDSASFDGWAVWYVQDQEVKPFLELEIDSTTGQIIGSTEEP